MALPCTPASPALLGVSRVPLAFPGVRARTREDGTVLAETARPEHEAREAR